MVFFICLYVCTIVLTVTSDISVGLFLNCGLSIFSINEYCIVLFAEWTGHFVDIAVWQTGPLHRENEYQKYETAQRIKQRSPSLSIYHYNGGSSAEVSLIAVLFTSKTFLTWSIYVTSSVSRQGKDLWSSARKRRLRKDGGIGVQGWAAVDCQRGSMVRTTDNKASQRCKKTNDVRKWEKLNSSRRTDRQTQERSN